MPAKRHKLTATDIVAALKEMSWEEMEEIRRLLGVQYVPQPMPYPVPSMPAPAVPFPYSPNPLFPMSPWCSEPLPFATIGCGRGPTIV